MGRSGTLTQHDCWCSVSIRHVRERVPVRDCSSTACFVHRPEPLTLRKLNSEVESVESRGVGEDQQRPPAGATYEALMRSEFSRGLSPVAWVARYRHRLHLGGIFEVSYHDQALEDWVQDVARIVYDEDTDLAALRCAHLSLWQRHVVRREERAERRSGCL